MAANRTLTTLSIALIVFVMLTFVLAVTTYLFFTQKIRAESTADENFATAVTRKDELDKLTEDFDTLRQLIGTEKERPTRSRSSGTS